MKEPLPPKRGKNIVERWAEDLNSVRIIKSATQANKENLEKLRQDFIKQFNIEKLELLTLKDYAIGNPANIHDNFCYWVERKLDGLGRILGATANKFGVYYSKKQGKYIWRKWTNEDFDVIKNAIIDLYFAGERHDINAIKKNPISPMFKGKILSLYFPDRYLNIFSINYLKYFLNCLSIFPESDDPVDLREQLITFNYARLHLPIHELAGHLDREYDNPKNRNFQSEQEVDEVYENRQKRIIQKSFNNVKIYSDTPEKPPEQVPIQGGMVYKINPNKSRRAIINANFLCEFNNNHESFIRRENEYRYTEAHHLIPRKYQKYFKVTLDTPANIISLCSNCHNHLHYGKDIEPILKKLYDERIERLRAVGIDISFEKLMEYYL